MSGYAVLEPVRRRPAREPSWRGFDVDGRVAPSIVEIAPPTPIDLVGQSLEDRIAARIDRIRATWSQTTFFLFDPESWR
jgi:hypothetical protein